MTNKKLTFNGVLYMQDEVIAWNKIFGINPTDKEYITLYQQLTYEECFGEGELVDSLEKGDKVGVLDALIDLVFTAFQWGVLTGLPVKEGDRKWFSSSVVDVRDKDEDLIILKERITDGEAFGSTILLIRLLYSYSEEFDIIGAFNRVLESNLSKAIHKSGNVDIAGEIAYIESQGRYADITCEESGEYLVFKAGQDVREGVVFDKPKVVKSSHFKSVEDLGGLEEFCY